jgi:hypothetical protein
MVSSDISFCKFFPNRYGKSFVISRNTRLNLRNLCLRNSHVHETNKTECQKRYSLTKLAKNMRQHDVLLRVIWCMYICLLVWCLSTCMMSAYIVRLPTNRQSSYLNDVGATLWCLPTWDVCSIVWFLPTLSCLPTCMMSTLFYGVCLPEWFFPRCVISTLLYNVRLPEWCLPIYMSV